MDWHWRLVESECIGCGICADLCPYEAIGMPRELAYPAPVAGKCVGCMICVEQCPVAAIEVGEVQVQQSPGSG